MRPVSSVILLSALVCAGSCAAANGRAIAPSRSSEIGNASYYGRESDGHTTASGAEYDEDRLTAAHRSLPFGARVRVTNLENRRSIVVTITDRGPFARGRIIDVSRRAARKLGFLRAGVTRVRLDVVRL
jgi:rare lipoprotein A